MVAALPLEVQPIVDDHIHLIIRKSGLQAKVLVVLSRQDKVDDWGQISINRLVKNNARASGNDVLFPLKILDP